MEKKNILDNNDAFRIGLNISDKVEIKDVRIIESSFKQTPNANAGNKSVEIENTTNVEFDAENNFIFVIADFKLRAFIKNNKDPVRLIRASFLLAYDFKDGFDKYSDEAFKAFAEINGVYNAWPYWREFVQNATVRMGLPSLTIPVWRVFPPSEAELPQKEGDKKLKAAKKKVAKTAKKKVTKKKAAKKKVNAKVGK